MPCHPDRVRRAYHDVRVSEAADPAHSDMLIEIRVTRQQIATCMTAREIEHTVWHMIHRAIYATPRFSSH